MPLKDHKHWGTVGEILLSTVHTLLHIQNRVALWGDSRAAAFLTWWTTELKRSFAEVIERGLIEMEREDAGA